jgi:hypothetical protein
VNLFSLQSYINEFYVSLPKLHCDGTLRLVQSTAQDNNFRKTAPVSLVEDYWICQ